MQFICNTVRFIHRDSVAYNHIFALFGAFPSICAEVRGSLMRDPCVYAVVGLCDWALSVYMYMYIHVCMCICIYEVYNVYLSSI